MRRIQSKKHEIRTHEVNKILLSCFDDKRQVLGDGICTLAYFHKDYKKQKIFQKILTYDHKQDKIPTDHYE